MTTPASRSLAVSCLAVALCAVPVASIAQTLADVARAAAASRKEQPRTGKTYTNDNLRADITPSTPGASTAAATDTAAEESSAPAAGSGAATASGSGGVSDSAPMDEAAWRSRISAARGALDRSMSFAAALQSQINGLTVDFINRDDPAQRAQIEQQRLKAVAELERTQRETEGHRKAIAAIEEDARKAGVPAGWLR